MGWVMGAPVIYKTLKENTGGQDLGQSQNPMGFPQHGKLFEEFSTVWKTFFHGVENGQNVAAGVRKLSQVSHGRLETGRGGRRGIGGIR
jgi:hypothetical protein